VIQAPGRFPSSAAISPTSELAPLPSRKARLDTMYMARWHRVSMTLVRRVLDKKPSALDRTTEIMIIWSSLPSSACQLYERFGQRAARALRRDTTRTLERVDIETFIFPLKIFVLKCLLECTSLCVVGGDYSKGFIFFL
jgi:hypothetical protein